MMKILLILFLFIITVVTYLIIVGGNINKTEEEKIREDQEQIEFFKKYKNKK